MRLYLDNSVLNRPFDNQRQPRIWLETLAFSLVLSLIEAGGADTICSAIHRLENDACPYAERRRWVEKCLAQAKNTLALGDAAKQRALELQGVGIKSLDALHIASAEQAGADYFLTCDDRLVRQYSGKLLLMNPQTFISSLGEKT